MPLEFPKTQELCNLKTKRVKNSCGTTFSRACAFKWLRKGPSVRLPLHRCFREHSNTHSEQTVSSVRSKRDYMSIIHYSKFQKFLSEEMYFVTRRQRSGGQGRRDRGRQWGGVKSLAAASSWCPWRLEWAAAWHGNGAGGPRSLAPCPSRGWTCADQAPRS